MVRDATKWCGSASAWPGIISYRWRLRIFPFLCFFVHVNMVYLFCSPRVLHIIATKPLDCLVCARHPPSLKPSPRHPHSHHQPFFLLLLHHLFFLSSFLKNTTVSVGCFRSLCVVTAAVISLPQLQNEEKKKNLILLLTLLARHNALHVLGEWKIRLIEIERDREREKKIPYLNLVFGCRKENIIYLNCNSYIYKYKYIYTQIKVNIYIYI